MRFQAFATDYDGTIAEEGTVRKSTVQALRALRASGRKLIMVTGRTLPDWLEVFPHTDIFHRVVADNGGLLYRPEKQERQLLTERVPIALVEELQNRGVPTFEGEIIVATYRTYEAEVRETLHHLGIQRDLILNKEAVMLLPPGVDKVTGLAAALEELEITLDHVVSVGDGENDITMLRACGCGVAVNNALDSVKEAADLILSGDRGAGAEELIAYLLKDDLASGLQKRTA